MDHFDNFSVGDVVDWLKTHYELWVDFLVHKRQSIPEFENYLAEHNAREERIRIYSDLHRTNRKVKNIIESNAVNQTNDVSVQLRDIDTQCSSCSSDLSAKEEPQSCAATCQFQSESKIPLILPELREKITEFRIKVKDFNRTIQKLIDNIEEIKVRYKSLEDDVKDFKNFHGEVSKNILDFYKNFNTVPCSANEKMESVILNDNFLIGIKNVKDILAEAVQKVKDITHNEKLLIDIKNVGERKDAIAEADENVQGVTLNENLLIDIKNVVKDAIAEVDEKVNDLTINESLSNDIKNIVRKAIEESLNAENINLEYKNEFHGKLFKPSKVNEEQLDNSNMSFPYMAKFLLLDSSQSDMIFEQHLIKESLQFNLSLYPQDIIKTRGNELILKFSDKENLYKLAYLFKYSNKLKQIALLDIPLVRSAKTVLLNIPLITETELYQELDKNKKLKGFFIYLERSMPTKNGKKNHWILGSDVETANLLLNIDYLCIALTKTRIVPYKRILRCFYCQRYGHIAKPCVSQQEHCVYCGDNHNIKYCNSEKQKCINCINQGYDQHNHRADFNQCPVFKDYKNSLVKSLYNTSAVINTSTEK